MNEKNIMHTDHNDISMIGAIVFIVLSPIYIIPMLVLSLIEKMDYKGMRIKLWLTRKLKMGMDF